LYRAKAIKKNFTKFLPRLFTFKSDKNDFVVNKIMRFNQILTDKQYFATDVIVHDTKNQSF